MNNSADKNPVARFTAKWQTLERVYEEYAKAQGLTYMSFTVLTVIYEQDGCCTQKLICEKSLYTKQSVNAIIKAFWQQGYVQLREEAADRRNKRIVFTAKGRAYAEAVVGRFSAVEQEAMAYLTDEQWRLLLEMAATFEEHFVAGVGRLLREAEDK